MHIDAGRKDNGNNALLRDAFRDGKICHRVLYKGERKHAADRVQHALDHPTEILHIGIDIMDIQGLALPHGGSQYQYDCGIASVVVGVLVAGVGSTIYRTIDTYHKSSDLIIEIFLTELSNFIERQGRVPSIIYLDVDGGSENANGMILCMLELLVAKGLADSIIFSR